MTRGSVVSFVLALGVSLASAIASAQTTSGTSATIVVPIIAQTGSFASEVTVYNPNAAAISVQPAFYDAQNTASPGLKNCNPLVVSGGRSVQFALAAQCALPAGGHFGLLLLTEQSGSQRFHGYARTQTPQGVGFSTEGFPIENFNDQLQHATGLKRQAANAGVPAYTTNCFVTTLGDAVSYELRLFDGTTNAQLGNTLAGSLQPFQQFRYLDVFAMAGAPAGDRSNVRAEFGNLTGASKKLIGFCTVQENTALSADFRIAKSYGGTPQNAFVQGGNAFGTTALLGTTDNQPLNVLVNGARAMRYEPNATSPNLVGGHPNNSAGVGIQGQTIGGGGAAGNTCFDPPTATNTRSCGNTTAASLAAVGGGSANRASGGNSTVGGGTSNTASGQNSTVAGGSTNTASGQNSTVGGGGSNAASGLYSTVAGGVLNNASGSYTFAGGRRAKATTMGSFIWADSKDFDFLPSVPNFFGVRATGGVGFTVAIDAGGNVSQFCNLLPGVAAWQCTSDRESKENFAPVDDQAILDQLIAMPLSTWNFKGADPKIRLLGPTAQDFHEAFALGYDDKTIVSTNVHGVALAAIRGLHALMRDRDAKLAELLKAQEATIGAQQRQIDALTERLAAFESVRAHVAVEGVARGVARRTGSCCHRRRARDRGMARKLTRATATDRRETPDVAGDRANRRATGPSAPVPRRRRAMLIPNARGST